MDLKLYFTLVLWKICVILLISAVNIVQIAEIASANFSELYIFFCIVWSKWLNGKMHLTELKVLLHIFSPLKFTSADLNVCNVFVFWFLVFLLYLFFSCINVGDDL